MEIIFPLKNGDRVLLRADDNNYELCRPRFRKDNETGEAVEEWTAFKWYAGLDHALMRIIDMKVRAGNAHTLKELAADIVAARKEIRAAWAMGGSTGAGCVASPKATNGPILVP